MLCGEVDLEVGPGREELSLPADMAAEQLLQARGLWVCHLRFRTPWMCGREKNWEQVWLRGRRAAAHTATHGQLTQHTSTRSTRAAYTQHTGVHTARSDRRTAAGWELRTGGSPSGGSPPHFWPVASTLALIDVVISFLSVMASSM